MGLPLYPQHLFLQASKEHKQTLINSKYNSGDKRGSEVLQDGKYDLLDIGFEPFKANLGSLSYSPPFPDISLTGLQNQYLCSHSQSFNTGMNHTKKLRGSESYFPGNHGSMASVHRMFEQLPHRLDSAKRNLVSLGYSNHGSLIQPNGNFSTSRPLSGTVKLELPSLQYPEADCCSRLTCPPPLPYEAIHTYKQSPPVAISPSSNWFETLVQSSEKRSIYSANSSNMYSGDREGSSNPNLPFHQSVISPFSTSYLDEFPYSEGRLGLEMIEPSAEMIFTPNDVEKDDSPRLNVLRSDDLLGSSWNPGASREPQ